MEEEPRDRLYRMVRAIMEAVPPIEPPMVYWLPSDSSYAYCGDCVVQARADELRIVFIPEKPQKFTWEYTADDEVLAEFARFFEEGIDGGFEGVSSDSPEHCETCGRTLWYTLTDYGVADELSGWLEMLPLADFNAEDSNALYRVTLNLSWSGANPQEVADALKIAESACAVLGIEP